MRRHRKVVVLTFTSLLLLSILTLSLQVLPLQQVINKPNTISTTPTISVIPTKDSATQEIISTKLLSDCSLQIMTTSKTSIVSTGLKSVGVQCNTQQRKGVVSPSRIFYAYEDVSGGIDSMVKIYFAAHNKDVVLYVFGTSSIFDIQFLPNDMLAVLNGYPDTPNEQWLTIYDIPTLFSFYPKNVDKYGFFSNIASHQILPYMKNINGEPRKLRTTNNTLELYDKSGSVLLRSFELYTYKIVGMAYRTVSLFYAHTQLSSDTCEEVVPVKREIPISSSPIKDTIEYLIQGNITADERNKGITSEFPYPGFYVTGVILHNGVLTLDFTEIPSFTTGGACRISSLRRQIEQTALQFNEVQEVRFKNPNLFQP